MSMGILAVAKSVDWRQGHNDLERRRYFKSVDYESNINRHVHIEYRMFVAFMTHSNWFC